MEFFISYGLSMVLIFSAVWLIARYDADLGTMRLFLTGERFQAERAVDYGLLHRVVPDGELEKAVQEETDAIALGGPIAIREAKKLVRLVSRLPEDEAYAYAETKIAKLFASEEAAEGMAAFVGKRPPRWPGGGGEAGSD